MLVKKTHWAYIIHDKIKLEIQQFLCASDELIDSVKFKRVFSTTDHIQSVKCYIRDGKKDRDTVSDAKLQRIPSDQGTFKNALSYAPNTQVPG